MTASRRLRLRPKILRLVELTRMTSRKTYAINASALARSEDSRDRRSSTNKVDALGCGGFSFGSGGLKEDVDLAFLER